MVRYGLNIEIKRYNTVFWKKRFFAEMYRFSGIGLIRGVRTSFHMVVMKKSKVRYQRGESGVYKNININAICCSHTKIKRYKATPFSVKTSGIR